MNGTGRPFAALRIFCIARFLARSLFSGLSLLRSDYAFAQGMCHTYLKGEFLGRAAPCQDNGDTG